MEAEQRPEQQNQSQLTEGHFAGTGISHDQGGEKENIMSLIKAVNYATGVEFSLRLKDAGLLSELERSGWLPAVENPNPHDLQHEEQQHEQWWKDHPNEEEKFSRSFEQREERLKYLYLGALLGRQFPELVAELKSQ